VVAWGAVGPLCAPIRPFLDHSLSPSPPRCAIAPFHSECLIAYPLSDNLSLIASQALGLPGGPKKVGGAAAELSRPRPRPHAHAHAHAHTPPHTTRHTPQTTKVTKPKPSQNLRPGAPIRPQPSFPSKAPARGPCAKTAAGAICVACPAPAAGGGVAERGPSLWCHPPAPLRHEAATYQIKCKVRPIPQSHIA
jgi:hypothetical protein